MTEHEQWDSTMRAAGIDQPERERIIRAIERRRASERRGSIPGVNVEDWWHLRGEDRREARRMKD